MHGIDTFGAVHGARKHFTAEETSAKLIAGGLTLLFFSNVAVYGGLFLWSVQALHLLLVTAAIVLPLFLVRDGLRIRLSAPFVLWCLAYLAICSLWYSLFAVTSVEPLRIRILSALFLLSTYAVFVRTEEAVRVARWALFGCVLFGVLLNAYDISHPFALVPATSEYALPGRAAGLYINPNQSGTALLLGFILTVNLLDRKWRGVYAFFVCCGVLLTASRAAIAGAGLVLVLLVWSGSLRFGQVVRMVVFSIALALILGYFVELAPGLTQLDWHLVGERINWFLDLGAAADFSQRERFALAQRAWDMFVQNPFFGSGLGSTELWSERSSTHNMYLAAMADFGLLGVLMFPALAVASAGGLRRAMSRQSAPFVGFVLWSGLVTHNVIGELYFMLAISLMAAVSEFRDADFGSAARG